MYFRKEVVTYSLLDLSCCRVIIVADSVFAIVVFLTVNISYGSWQRRWGSCQVDTSNLRLIDFLSVSCLSSIVESGKLNIDCRVWYFFETCPWNELLVWRKKMEEQKAESFSYTPPSVQKEFSGFRYQTWYPVDYLHRGKALRFDCHAQNGYGNLRKWAGVAEKG